MGISDWFKRFKSNAAAMEDYREGVAQPQDIDDCCLIGTEVVAALADACIRLADGDVRAAGIETVGPTRAINRIPPERNNS